jgi:acyl-CoA thioesterase-2
VAGSIDELLAVLVLEGRGGSIHRGVAPAAGSRSRVFGGQVLAQSLVAASTAAPAVCRPGSIQASFLRPGELTLPIDYAVELLAQDGDERVVRVVAQQVGRTIYEAVVRFVVGDLPTRTLVPAPDGDAVESLPDFEQRTRAAGFVADPADWSAIEYRYATPLDGRDWQLVHHRAGGPLPDDTAVHAAVHAYACDLTLIDTALYRFGLRYGRGGLRVASLDHSMWFHRPLRADEWTAHQQWLVTCTGGRALVMGEMSGRDGQVAVTTAQEGLVRIPREHSAR